MQGRAKVVQTVIFAPSFVACQPEHPPAPSHGSWRKSRCAACLSFLRRCSTRLTPAGCHLPPSVVGISRASNSSAMALNEVRPFACSSVIIEASTKACASAARLLSWPLLILAPLPDVSRPRRVSILTTVVYCHLPPRAVGIRLRFSSSASAWRETKPAALSLRRVETRARARASAARLMASGPPRIPRLRDEAPSRTCFIGPSWLDLDVLR